MAGRYTDEQLLWIKEQLDVHGEHVRDLLQEAIDAKNLIQTEDLRNSIDYKVINYGDNPVLQILFMSYGRAIEIAWHKKSQNSKALSQRGINRDILSARSKPKVKRKDTRWYARNVYGSLNRLIGILMYEFSEETVARMKNILDQQKLRAS